MHHHIQYLRAQCSCAIKKSPKLFGLVALPSTMPRVQVNFDTATGAIRPNTGLAPESHETRGSPDVLRQGTPDGGSKSLKSLIKSFWNLHDLSTLGLAEFERDTSLAGASSGIKDSQYSWHGNGSAFTVRRQVSEK